MRFVSASLVAVLLAIPLLAGCMGPSGPGGGGAGGVVFTTATIGEPESLDPAYDYETSGGTVIQQVYETLVYYERDSATVLEPVLATQVPSKENGLLSADGLTYTFPLKQGVRFHDGSEMTAEDVKFGFDRTILMNDPGGPAWISNTIKGAREYMASDGTAADRARYLEAGGVEVVDPTTVRVTLERPDAAFLYKIAFHQAAVLPKAVFLAEHPERVESWGVATTSDGLPPPAQPGKLRVTRDPWADRNAVGTGPFTLERWVPGDKVILKAFPDYHGDPKPSIDRVVIQKVGDLNTRILMLRTGQADDILVPPSDLAQLQGMPGVHIEDHPSFNVGALLFNRDIKDPSACPVDALTGQPDCAFFDDIHMRRVFAHSFDYEGYLRDVAKGYGVRIGGVVPQGMFGFDPDVVPHPLDRERALLELAQSKHPAGFKITINFNTGNAGREGGAQMLKQGLEALHPGIEVRTQPLDWATAMLPSAKRGALAAYFIGWAPDYAFPDDYVIPFGHSVNGTYPKWSGLQDLELDRLIDDAMLATDPDDAAQRYAAVQRRMSEQYHYMFLFQSNIVHVSGDWVKGYFYNPMDSGQPHVGQYKYIRKEV